MKKQTESAFVFVGPTDDGETLCWSNETGWGDKESATVFYSENASPPLGSTGREPAQTMTPEKARQLDQFADAYAEALYWSSTDERDGETVNLDDYMTSTQADDECRADCLDFFTENYDALAAAASSSGYSWSHAGHDFALTRNHHGAGYWDRGLGALGDTLTRAAHAAGTVYAYLGDDELIYIQ